MKKEDKIYSQKLSEVKDFEFDEQVVEVFDDMISRSVPLYQDVQEATAELCAKICLPNSSIYDLGCSRGTTLIKIASRVKDNSVKLVGIDNSPAMVESCKQRLAGLGLTERITIHEAELEELQTSGASVVILNYTLQFIAPSKRQKIIAGIHRNLLPGGALIISEKVVHEHPLIDKLMVDLHQDFKRQNGYSELEIAQKREALENILIPNTTEKNLALIKSSGFSNVEVVLKWYNFVSLIAIKD